MTYEEKGKIAEAYLETQSKAELINWILGKTDWVDVLLDELQAEDEKTDERRFER